MDKIYQPKVNLHESFKTQLELLINEINEEDSIVLVAEENNHLVGYALGKLKEPHPLFNVPKSGLIDDVGIVNKERNKGTGKKLVNELIQWFKTNGAERIDLKVHDKANRHLSFG